jgi:hypothetical protein
MDTSLTQTAASHESKIDDIRAELAKLSHDANRQLAQLCHSVSAIQAKLFNTTDTADDAVNIPAATHIQHRHQRARVSDDHVPILARNEVLDTVFSFVGIGEYQCVAGVCRNWRGRFKSFCNKTPTRWSKRILSPHTSYSSIEATAARLQLTLDNGPTIDRSDINWHCSIVNHSLEPVQVWHLARLHGMQWLCS